MGESLSEGRKTTSHHRSFAIAPIDEGFETGKPEKNQIFDDGFVYL